MKYTFKSISLILLSLSLVSCSSYKIEGSNYYELKDCYRQYNLKEEETIENFQLYSVVNYYVYPGFYLNGKFDIDINIQKDYMFFTLSDMTKDGIESIYNTLNITIPSELTDKETTLNLTHLKTFNDVTSIGQIDSIYVNTESDPEYTTLGLVCNTEVYTFNYKDLRKKDGSEIETGEFKIYKVLDIPLITKFIPYSKQNLNNNKD